VLKVFENSLSDCLLTVVGRERQFEVMRELALGSSVPTNIVVVAEESAVEWVEDSQCTVYRADDRILDFFECRREGFKVNSRPVYSSVTEKIVCSKSQVVFVHLRESESVVRDFLTQLESVQGNRALGFVYMPPKDAYIVNLLLNEPFNRPNLNFAVFNFPEKSHFNTTHFIPQQSDDAVWFEPADWRGVVNGFLAAIRNGTVEKLYLNEKEIPRVHGNMQRVAEYSFRQYVMNESADVFVLFEKAKCRRCMQAYDHYRRFAAVVLANGIGKYELKHMMTTGNRIAGGFPLTRLPAIVFDPANNISAVRVGPDETFDVNAWFAQKYPSEKHKIAFELPDEGKMTKIEERVEELAKGQRQNCGRV
jgi:hypothetical protein